ncbi:MAG: hypothetical protein ABSA75_09755 [Candidatus Bathyarchaeia archaeon]
MKIILLVIVVSILCLSVFIGFSLKVTAASVPVGIVHSIQITLTNVQSVATPFPYEQMISINSSAYSSFEASNLQNVEFFNPYGSLIHSWLESGDSSSSANTIYWLKLPDGIHAKSSVTIYLGFSSPTTNLFNGQTIGEAPSLSSAYGQYDDGAGVFAFYDNFAGRTLSSSWVDQSALSTNTFAINNGMILYSAASPNNLTAVNSVKTFSQGITEFYGAFPSGTKGGVFDAVTVGLHGESGWDSDIGVVAGSYGLVTKNGGNWNTAPGLSFGADNVYSLMVPSADIPLRLAEVNYDSTISGTSYPTSLPQPIGLQNQVYSGVTLGPIYWVRERAYPPDGVMPAVAVNGQSSPAPQSGSILGNPFVIGGIIAAVVAVIGVAVYFFVIARGGAEAAEAGVTGAAVAEAGEASAACGEEGSGGGAGSGGSEGLGSGGGGSGEEGKGDSSASNLVTVKGSGGNMHGDGAHEVSKSSEKHEGADSNAQAQGNNHAQSTADTQTASDSGSDGGASQSSSETSGDSGSEQSGGAGSSDSGDV